MAGSPSALSKLGIGKTDPVDTPLSYTDFDIGVTRELLNTNGTRGSFFGDGNRWRENRQTVGPRMSLEPTAVELAYILEWIQGGTPSGSPTVTYPWSNTAGIRNLHFHPQVGEEWFLAGCGVDSASFSASSGEALKVDLDCIGQTYDSTRSNLPSLSYDLTKQPFILSDLVLSVGGVTRKCRELTFGIRNGIDRSRFLNSLTLTTVQKLAGGYTFGIDVPSGDNASQFWSSGVSGTAIVATFTNPVTSSVFTISAVDVRLVPKSPTYAAGGEGFIRLEGEAVRDSTSDPVTITLSQ